MIPALVGCTVSAIVLTIGTILNRKHTRNTRRANLNDLRAIALRDSYLNNHFGYKQRCY